MNALTRITPTYTRTYTPVLDPIVLSPQLPWRQPVCVCVCVCVTRLGTRVGDVLACVRVRAYGGMCVRGGLCTIRGRVCTRARVRVSLTLVSAHLLEPGANANVRFFCVGAWRRVRARWSERLMNVTACVRYMPPCYRVALACMWPESHVCMADALNQQEAPACMASPKSIRWRSQWRSKFRRPKLGARSVGALARGRVYL